ncbi:MAG: HYR domain-containing protein [Blastocatellia bacterium]
MSPSRMTNSICGRISPRLALCAVLIGLGLAAFPQPNAQTSIDSSGPGRTAGETRSASLRQDGSLARRVAGLSDRLSFRQLPANDGEFTNSLSMTSGDFDRDGVRDLVVGQAGSGHFALSLYRGNPDALYPDNPDARQRKAANKVSPPLSPSASIAVAEPPDFLAAGDFNGDGRLDVAAAARDGNALYLLAGDDAGRIAPAQRIELAGRVTAMAAGNTCEPDGSNELAVGIVGRSGPEVILFDSPKGSLNAQPKIMSLPAEAKVIAFTRLAGSRNADLLVAAGSELLFVLGEDQSTFFGSGQAGIPASVIHRRSFASTITSIATGNFTGHHNADVALLTADGSLVLLAESALRQGDAAGWEVAGVTVGSWPGATFIIRARASGSQADDLVIVDPGRRSLHLMAQETVGADSSSGTPAQSRVFVSVAVEGEPSAVLPMRLSEHALNNLVMLRKGQIAATSVQPAVATTFVVTTTTDNGDDMAPTPGSLREAILDANANAGADTIIFNIPTPPPHIIIPPSPLPAITEAVTINGTSQPDFSGTPVVELNGISAGVSNGLVINAPSCSVRGLVINRFSGSGIAVTGNGNIIEGNFIGTNATASFALGNAEDGVVISAGSTNLIGGTTAAARNLLSGNRNGVQILGVGTGNQVRGNSIGTNIAGNLSLGNSINGVLILGASGTAIGAVGSASSNTISFNGGAGVAVASGTNNAILSNSIVLNGGLGIDLAVTGVTPNDLGDGDLGANNRQNFPVITSASAAGTSTAIVGTLNSNANTVFGIEFFSNQVPNASGFGEGQTFIGSATVTTDGAGDAGFNLTFPVTVPPGQVITATATDPTGNTSEFSRAVQVGGVVGGQPADLSVLVNIAPNPVETGSNVTKTIFVTNAGPGTATSVTVTDVLSANTSFVSCASTGGGVCGGSGNNRTVTFASLAPGASALITIVAGVNCSVANGAIIGNTAMVFSPATPDLNTSNNVASATTLASNPAPRITCPGNIVQATDSGQCTGTANFAPLVVDNCPGSGVSCSPPAGSNFSIGTTTVNCIATDAGGATATCSFTVTINDLQPLIIVCPASFSISALPGQCSPVVNYPAPTVVDNCPGATVVCAPPSGSAFPVGTTTVTCTATGSNAGSGSATCSFMITVIGLPQAELVIEGNGPALEFGPVVAKGKSRKIKKQPGRNFTIENVGCVPFTLSLESIRRLGNDVDRGRITDSDDQRLFSVNLVSPEGVLTKLEILKHVIIGPGEKLKFRVLFNPVIPPVTRETRGLAAHQVLPNLITSRVTFRLDDGSAITINLVARVDTAVKLIDPQNPKKPPLIVFQRAGNEFVIEYSIYDSNLDVSRASYQFFDRRDRPVGGALTVSLTELVQQRGVVTGQTFTVVQKISGANDHGEIVGVVVTVSDHESSASDSND